MFSIDFIAFLDTSLEADLDKMENEIEDFGKNLRKKYKEYLPKKDLDSKN